MFSMKNNRDHSFLCNLNILDTYFSIDNVFSLSPFCTLVIFFLPVTLHLLSFTVCGFTIQHCPSTIFEITAGSIEKHSDKGRLNCDFRPTISYRNKWCLKKLILFQYVLMSLVLQRIVETKNLKVTGFCFSTQKYKTFYLLANLWFDLFFFFFVHSVWLMRFQFPNQGSNLGPR